MINHYTANKKVRNADAYSPGGRIGLRPDRATLSYCQRAREAFAASAYRQDAAPVIRLAYDAGDVHQKVALAVRAMWQEVLGVRTGLRAEDFRVLRQAIGTPHSAFAAPPRRCPARSSHSRSHRRPRHPEPRLIRWWQKWRRHCRRHC